ncbi:MAG TPA: hypothetical protein VGU20_26050 [Stellaceae bacterium]|nr:hypothetical protein [Stellaceae bacterium]
MGAMLHLVTLLVASAVAFAVYAALSSLMEMRERVNEIHLLLETITTAITTLHESPDHDLKTPRTEPEGNVAAPGANG